MHPDLIQKFTNALQKGMDYVNSHTAEEIAKTIQPQFAETPLENITKIVKRYQEGDRHRKDRHHRGPLQRAGYLERKYGL